MDRSAAGRIAKMFRYKRISGLGGRLPRPQDVGIYYMHLANRDIHEAIGSRGVQDMSVEVNCRAS